MVSFLPQPHFRRRFFEDPELTWSFEYETFGEEFHYFFYVLKKVCVDDVPRVSPASRTLDKKEKNLYLGRSSSRQSSVA